MKRSTSKKLQQKYVYTVLSAMLVAIALTVSFFVKDIDPVVEVVHYTDYPFYVTFIDVGQGDCELISCNGVNILVDGGEARNSQKVINYMKHLEIEKLDCYIATHPHSAHIGAASAILSEIPCDKVFTTYFSEFNIPTSDLYENFIDTVYDNSIEAVAVEAGDEYVFGDLKINIHAPLIESEDYNEMSIVFTATYGETSVLFTGDTTVEVEKQMLESEYYEDVDVLKVAHHGSTTSSYEPYISAVLPEYAVISCGEGNSYGHPHDEIIELFDNKGIRYLRTDEYGSVVCYSDGKSYKVEAIG